VKSIRRAPSDSSLLPLPLSTALPASLSLSLSNTGAGTVARAYAAGELSLGGVGGGDGADGRSGVQHEGDDALQDGRDWEGRWLSAVDLSH
jgi:hypothetical protein